MENVNKVHVKIGDIELSIEGDEEFINKYSGSIELLLSKLENHTNNKTVQDSTTNGSYVETNGSPDELSEFVLKYDSDKPSENALLLAAFHFSQYGIDPFSYEEIKIMADEAGIMLPDRVDMTFKGAQRDGKSLFTSAGRGKVKPTIHGQQFFKEEYNVGKGTLKKNGE